ncbi:DNA-binding transcriptional regulator, LysR family [Actinomadura madurae]|uniref:DNA-binding transcriptional regulator, LysR family n=1 Tax=Actinomadura madurae TaxID=1993 RepID=A0A1I5IZH3_9ACTN|nr:LysR family transcriptional regulator [Actinomadura madurae]SFO65760.1 DNA-binding transcriptional regulator, LysR family [Actinomadura madurae]
MTLTQLGAFVLVARLGSVKEAARALNVSEPAVSQALAALRQHLGDPLLVRGPGGMTLTEGGARLLPIASQMVVLGAEAEGAVRAARGAPEALRVVAVPAIAEFVATSLLDAFAARSSRPVEGSAGVVAGREMPVLLHNRLADVALGPRLADDPGLVSEPVYRAALVAVGTVPAPRPLWLVDPSGTDPGSETARLLRRLKVPEDRIRVYPNQTAAWAAAADGDGLAIALAHLVAPRVQRGELHVIATPATPLEIRWHATTLAPDRRPPLAGVFRRFLATAEALHIMRSPGSGVPPSRFRPPVYVTIWS